MLSVRHSKMILLVSLCAFGNSYAAEYRCTTNQPESEPVVVSEGSGSQTLGRIVAWYQADKSEAIVLIFASDSQGSENQLIATLPYGSGEITAASFDRGSKKMLLRGSYRKHILTGWNDFQIDCDRIDD